MPNPDLPTHSIAPHWPAASVDAVLDMDLRFIALDVETANGEMSSICQIGLACVRADGQIATLGFLVNPRGVFEQFNTRLHGIDAATVTNAPDFAGVFAPLRRLLDVTPLVQHSGFDKRAMNAACQRFGLEPLGTPWHDSVTIARRAWPQLTGNGGHGLASLKSFLSLEFEHHDAVEDARAAAQVVLCAEAETGHRFDLLSGRPARAYGKQVTRAGNKDGPFYGQVACITGKLSRSRDAVATLAATAGIRVAAKVNADVTLLVIADRDLDTRADEIRSTKLRDAQALIAQGHRLRILRESEFLDLIGI
ncbi:exonuclease domain-containing protein [Pararhodobacter sp.]|uniref:exonuclease domain-containing protein n=1 Tax=Pararhodobacter sp. TaxID=2127056 RepID=UPI002AFEDCE6|nr:exonuclease domain-containing protein [Pararhodobacter sp.]